MELILRNATRALFRHAIILTLPFLIACQEQISASADQRAASRSCVSGADGPFAVAHVSDADTIVVEVPGRKRLTVRLIGVDAPEIEGPYRKAEPGGVEARQFVQSMLERADVYLESDPSQRSFDQYGRRLAYVHRASDCAFVNGEIIRQGHGENYRKFRFRHRDLFDRYEREARSRRLGLWQHTPAR